MRDSEILDSGFGKDDLSSFLEERYKSYLLAQLSPLVKDKGQYHYRIVEDFIRKYSGTILIDGQEVIVTITYQHHHDDGCEIYAKFYVQRENKIGRFFLGSAKQVFMFYLVSHSPNKVEHAATCDGVIMRKITSVHSRYDHLGPVGSSKDFELKLEKKDKRYFWIG